ncbi:MAG: LLM class flavin-dependent oxidoreductase [Nocardioides sp.]
MKLALYLPNFRDHVTVQELADLTDLAEELDFDSVWTLDRIVVPEASDRGELQYSFGMMKEFPKQLPVSSHGKWLQGWPLLPWLAARTEKLRIGMSITDTPYRSPGVFAAECATIDQLSGGRLNVGIGSGWMPEEFAASSAAEIFPRRHAHVRETIEICQGIWTNETFEYHGEFADFEPCGFGHQPVQKPHRQSTSAAYGTRSARPTGWRNTAWRAGSGSRTPRGSSPSGAPPSATSSRSSASRSTTCRCAA